MTRPLPPRAGRRGLGAIFRMPLLVALASLAGLVVALTGDGWRDIISWAALAVPLAAFAWAFARRN